MKSKRPKHRPKPDPDPIEPEVIDPVSEVIYGAAGLPTWINNEPDPKRLYSFAIHEMCVLAKLCPDMNVRYQATKFLAQEFAPQVPSEREEERERRMAHIEIEQILQAKGLRPP